MRSVVETYVEEHGDGPPIIVLHGFTGDTTSMHAFSDGLDGCGRRILLDFIGHGKSEAPERTVYTMADAIGQVRTVAASLEAPPVLVGYSMGARIAVAAAAQGMELRGLVTIGGRAGIADPEERTLRRAADNRLADDIVEHGVEWFVEYWERQPFYASQQALGTSHLLAGRLQRLGNSPHALAAALRGMGAGAQDPLHESLPLITTPTLVIVGELDLRFRVYADELVEGLPNAELSVVPIAGHAAHIEAAGETARRVRAFLTRI